MVVGDVYLRGDGCVSDSAFVLGNLSGIGDVCVSNKLVVTGDKYIISV